MNRARYNIVSAWSAARAILRNSSRWPGDNCQRHLRGETASVFDAL